MEKEDTVKQSKNEFLELFFTTMIAYLIALHYLSLKQFEEAFVMQTHAMSETQNALDCFVRCSLAKIAQCAEFECVLRGKVLPDLKRISVVAHAKLLNS